MERPQTEQSCMAFRTEGRTGSKWPKRATIILVRSLYSVLRRVIGLSCEAMGSGHPRDLGE